MSRFSSAEWMDASCCADMWVGANRSTQLQIGITEKGYMDLKITARGKGDHSSTPPRHTPAARLFAFANEVEKKRPFQKKLIPEAVEMFRQMALPSIFP